MKEQLKAAFTQWPHCIATYVALLGAIWLLAFGWKPVKVDFPIYVVANPEMAATQKAYEVNGKVWSVAFTGSMKPLLQGGEIVVTKDSFESLKQGEVVVYTAYYHNRPIIHRAVEKDKHGWLMSGDSSRLSESWARVTKDNYLGTAVVAYRKP